MGLDSESGGAKGHYPDCSTAFTGEGSKGAQFFSELFHSGCFGGVQATARKLTGLGKRKEFRMPKPPESPPNSDLEGVHQDGTRPSKRLTDEESGEKLARADRENKARPDYSDDRSGDDRTR